MDCKKAHQRMKATRDHSHVVTLDQLEEELRKKMACPEHGNEELKLFCENCDKPICCECLLVGHRSHCLSSLSEACLKYKAIVTDLLHKAMSYLHGLQASIKAVREMELKVEQKVQLVAREIKAEFAELHKALAERESVLFKN